MPPQQSSRTDWRYRVARDQNWRRSPWLLTTPDYNTTAGDQALPVFFPEAYRRRHTDRGFAASSPMALLTYTDPSIPPVWGNPTGYQRPIELLTWIQTRGPEYDDQEVKPFKQDEWPVPRGYPFPIEDRGFVQNSPLIVIATPFRQDNWPVPEAFAHRKRVPTSNYGFAKGWDAHYLSLRHVPFYMHDWPVPRGYPYPLSLRFQGPQVFLYIYVAKGYATLSDSYAYGARLSDDFAYGGTIDDTYAHGGTISDE